MSIEYTEKHDICFWKEYPHDSSNTYAITYPMFAWDDWGLIPNSRPYISTPKANYTLTQIPNSSNRLDITNYMPGGMTYESRTGEWQFAIDHTKKIWKNWYNGYYKIEEYFHGGKFLVAISDDPTKIYEGRIYVSSYDPGDNYSSITLSYDLDAMPIDISSKSDMQFRVRWFDYKGNLLREQMVFSGAVMMGLNYVDIVDMSTIIPKGAVPKGWDPPYEPIDRNTDYYPTYYFISNMAGSVQAPASMANMSGAVSSHPIQYIIEEPEAIVEKTYEVPDSVKFLFNNVKYSIDVIGTGGTTQKRLWYTPNNLGIETE